MTDAQLERQDRELERRHDMQSFLCRHPEWDEPADTVPCEACDGEAAPLGQLGRLTHYRCVCCGWTFSQGSES